MSSIRTRFYVLMRVASTAFTMVRCPGEEQGILSCDRTSGDLGPPGHWAHERMVPGPGGIVRPDPVAGPRRPTQAKTAARNTAEAGAYSSSGRAPVPPANAAHLILQMWNSLSWNRAGQAALLILALSAAITSILWGIGRAIQPFAAHSEAWTTISAIAAASGTSALTMSAGRRRNRPRRDQ